MLSFVLAGLDYSKMKMNIAKQSDLSALTNFMSEVVEDRWHKFANKQEIQAQVEWFNQLGIFDAYLANGRIIYIADKKGILACAGVKMLSKEMAYFGYCYAREQGQGLASLLTGERLKFARSRGALYVLSEVIEGNHNAFAHLERHGFAYTGQKRSSRTVASRQVQLWARTLPRS